MSKKAILLAIAGSIALHTGALSLGKPEEPVLMAATEGMGIASLGNSFEDMVSGDPIETPPEDLLEPLEEEEPLPEEEILPEPLEMRPITPPKPVEEVVEEAEPVEVVEVALSDVVVLEAAPEALPEVPLEAVEVVLEAPPLAQVEPVTETVAPEPIEEALEALPEEEVEPEPTPEAVAEAPRPPRRPERPRETPREEKPREQPRQQPRGQQQNAVRGTEAGTAAATANASQGNGRSQSAEAGNAAASNYPGTVMRKLSRTRRGNVNGRGTAVISFTVAANGAAQGISVARSSGNDRIDRAGMELVQRASPFGPPPSGAQTRFNYEFSAR